MNATSPERPADRRPWMTVVAVTLLAWVVLTAYVALALPPPAELYEERGSGCRELTAEGQDELARRALPAQIGFVLWTLAGATALGYGWRSAARTPAARGAALASLGLLAALLSAWGVVLFVMDALVAFLLTIALVVWSAIVASTAAAVGALLGRRAVGTFGRPVARLRTRGVVALQAVWMLAAVLVPILSGGSGEIPVC